MRLAIARRVLTAGAAGVLVATSVLPGLPAGAQSPDAADASPAVEWPDLGTWTPERIDQEVSAILAAELERFGVAAFDPELPGILNELRRSGAQDLQEILDSQSRPEVPGAEGRVLFASIGGPTVRTDPVFDQGGTLLSVIGAMAVEVPGYILGLRPGPGAAVVEPAVYQKSGTSTVGGRDITTQQRVKVRNSLDHSTAELSREMSETFAVPGPDGQLRATVTDSATVLVRIDVCPDANGVVKGQVRTSADTTFDSVDGPDYHSTFTSDDQILIQVDDQARISASQHAVTAERKATGHRPAFGDDPAADTNVTLQMGGTISTGAGGQTSGILDVAREQGADFADVRITTLAERLAREIAASAGRSAESVWQHDRCLKVVPDPAGATVMATSQTPINVTVHHIVEDQDVPLPVAATLSGPGSIVPNDSPQPAPVVITYTAPADDSTATIMFRSVSKRGISRVPGTYITKQEACPSAADRVLVATVGGAGADVLVAQDDPGGAEPTCPPEPVTLEGTVDVVVSREPDGPYDTGFTLTWHLEAIVLARLGPNHTYGQDSGTVTSTLEFYGNCVGQGSWQESFSDGEAGGPSPIYLPDGTKLGEVQIGDGPVGMAGGPQANGERLDINMLHDARVEVTCADNYDGSIIPPRGESLGSCPASDDTVIGAMLVLPRGADGSYRGGCEWTDDFMTGTSGSWTAEFRVVPP